MSTTVKTNHMNPNRTGANLTETTLTTQAVGGGRFGRLWRRGVRGAVYAQPIYVPGVQIGGQAHNVVYIATMHNYVYAFDADNPALPPLWGPVPLGPPVTLPDGNIGGGGGYRDISAEIGVISTPEASTTYNVLYVVSATREGSTYHHRLHALDLATGAERLGGPRDIQANGFVHHLQNQRPGLLKFQDSIFIAFASYGDYNDANAYHGWVLKYGASDLQFQGAFNATPGGGQGGIWMAGQGPAADDSSVYVMTGNGSTDPNGSELACAVIEIDASSFQRRGYFMPTNYAFLNGQDLDLGSGGVLVVPGADIVIAGGKDGRLFVLRRHALPNAADDSRAVQWFYATAQPGDPGELPPAPASAGYHHIHGSPVFWQGPMGRWIYLAGEADYFKAFALRADNTFAVDPTTHRVPPASQSTVPTPPASMPGGILALSANGAAAGSGVLWAAMPFRENGNQKVVDGVLYAFDASDLTRVLWHSKMNATRDDVGAYPKFCPPVPVDGKVFVPSLSGPYEHCVLQGETAVDAPALASFNDDRLVLSWTGTDGANSLNVARSVPSFETDPQGLRFTDKRTLTEASHSSPALAFGNGTLFLAWTGTDPNSSLNVSRATDFVGQGWFGKVTLGERSPYGPALAFFQGCLYIAWVGTDPNHKLNVAWSTDFQNFNKQTFADTSDAGPALCTAGDRLVLAWRGQDPNRSLNVVQSLDGMNWDFANKVVMGDSSDFTPGLCLAEALYLAWTGRDPNKMLNLLSADQGPNEIHAFDAKQTYQDTSAAGLALTTFRGRAFVGWAGTDGAKTPNVAAITAGQVSAYGLI